MPSKDLAAWLHWIKSYHDQAINYSLDNIQVVAEKLDLIQFSVPVITVAGTNGKGSCIASMEAILISHGFKVGSYTSPHMFNFTERIKINSIPVRETELCAAMQVVHDCIVEHDMLQLSYFEFATLAALWIFKQAGLEYILLEVGLGGRLDAVNIVKKTIAIITSISLDHCAYLGTTRDAIGLEKAGIVEQNGILVYGEKDIPASVINIAQQQNAKLYLAQRDYRYDLSVHKWSWNCKDKSYSNLPQPSFPIQNAAAALQALSLLPNLGLDGTIVHEVFGSLTVVGRFQTERLNGKEYIFDVAHNPAAVYWLNAKLKNLEHNGRTFVVLGIAGTKDSIAMLQAWQLPVNKWLVCTPKTMRRATSIDDLTIAIKSSQAGEVVSCETVEYAFKLADQCAEPNDRVIIFGSFHTVAKALEEYTRMNEHGKY